MPRKPLIAFGGRCCRQTLLTRAHRRTGGVPPERIVRHVLSVTQGGDWSIQRDALDAVLRRCASTHTDEIQIVGRPRGRLQGLYATRRRGRAHGRTAHCSPERPARRELRVRRFSPELARAVQAPDRRPRGRGLEAAARRCRARVGFRVRAPALGSRPSIDWPRRLAGADSVGERHTGPRSAALAASSRRQWLDGHGARSVGAAAGARRSIARCTPRRRR
jgi:hypothetical protein